MSSERTPTALTALEPEYWILGEIGRGGTAIVYLARDRATGDEVAIKLIRPKYVEDEEAIARFAREARFVTQLNHPNVVGVHRVLDLGAAGIALVMAHIDGRTLKQVIQQDSPLPPDFVVNVLRQVAAALAAAHRMGIVHRDVKPENVFIDSDGKALLADFGVARSMSGDTQLTMHGVAIGTPSYMAPEQIDGDNLDGRADVYSLGLVAWEMFTGHRPWEGESLYAVLYHQKHHELPDVRVMRPDLSDQIAHAIAGAIEKDVSARWQSMDELIDALDGAAPQRRAQTHAPVTTERSASSVRSRRREARRPESCRFRRRRFARCSPAPEEQVPSPPRIRSRSMPEGGSSRASSARTSRRTSWKTRSRRDGSPCRVVRWRSGPRRSSAWWRSASSRLSSKDARMGRRTSSRRGRRRE